MMSDNTVYTQAYADDIAVLIQGRQTNDVCDRAQAALLRIDRWCATNGLTVNPAKTVTVMFTKKRRFIWNECTLHNIPIPLSSSAKYLGVTLDSKLLWREHLLQQLTKATRLLFACKSMTASKWGLKPSVMFWLYSAVIRPILAHGAIVWWTRLKRVTASVALTRLQRLALLCMTGALRGTPTAAMEAILSLPPIKDFLISQALSTAYRLRQAGRWLSPPNPTHRGHARIFTEFEQQLPVLEMPGDFVTPGYRFESEYRVQIQSRQDWQTAAMTDTHAEDKCCVQCYTDGSKDSMGRTGAGFVVVYCDTILHKGTVTFDQYTTVFQAETLAISECAAWLLTQPKDNWTGINTIVFYSDSQAVLNSLASLQATDSL
jgi:hypothetical protein